MKSGTTLPQLSWSSILRSAAGRTPNKVALIEAGRRLTFAQLRDRAQQVSASAASMGVAAGDTVMLIAPNCLEFIEIVIGFSQLGVAVAVISPRLSSQEVRSIVDDCSPRAIFVDPDFAAPQSPSGAPVISIGPDYEAWLTQGPASQSFNPVDETLSFAIPYTSGSTGAPKGVMLSQRTRILTAYAAAGEYGCFSPDDRYLAVSPLYHGGGLAYALASLMFGGCCELLRDFDPEQVLDRMAFGETTGIFLVPTHFHRMLAVEAKFLESRRSRGRLKTIISNAAPLPDELRYRILDFWGEGLLHETYGSTEAGIVSNLRPADQRRKKRCVGLAFPNTEILVANDNGVEVPTGEPGELLSRSPYNFSGYLGRPEETASVQRNGWIAVGDLARRDDEGYIYIVGRKKDMIISGGLNIYPKEIEDILALHPAVAEVAVVGLLDQQWGESPAAALVMRDGMHASDEALTAFCRERLAGYKVPKRFMAFAALPRGPLGKIQKGKLIELMSSE
jgi:acyl-CoA synthetase (AMP-forming)/AMP-acid ligase II